MRRTLAVLAGLGLAATALPALAAPGAGVETVDQASLTACGTWSIAIEDDENTTEDEERHDNYYVCADRFDDDGDGTDDRAGVSVTRLGDSGYLRYAGAASLSDVLIDAENGTASILATIGGASDATAGKTCTVEVTFVATGDSATSEGQDTPYTVSTGEGSASAGLLRSYSSTETPALGNGTACGFDDIAGDSTDGSITSYSESTETLVVSAG